MNICENCGREMRKIDDHPVYGAMYECADCGRIVRKYREVFMWAHATIDAPDGSRWFGQVYRCPERIRRLSHDDLTYLTTWPNPVIA